MSSNKITALLKRYYKTFDYNQKYRWDKIALSYMTDAKKILDIGCGEGRFISHNPQVITGVDHNRNSLKICEDKGYTVQHARATDLPFDDSSFDAVHCSHVIEHLLPQDAYKLLSEMNRVLKPGGIFCLRTPLLHRGFYSDLTHIRPYNPEAVLHYIKTEESSQRTLDPFDGLYRKIKIKYRRGILFPSITFTRFWVLAIISHLLYRLGITSFKAVGYMLILKKIK